MGVLYSWLGLVGLILTIGLLIRWALKDAKRSGQREVALAIAHANEQAVRTAREAEAAARAAFEAGNINDPFQRMSGPVDFDSPQG